MGGLFILLSYLYMSRQPPSYSAYAEVVVKDSPYPMYGEFPALFQDYTTKSTRVAKIKTNAVLKRAIKTCIKYFPDALDEKGKETDGIISYIEYLRAALQLNHDKDTDIVRISIVDINPQKAIDIVNAVAEGFGEQALASIKEGITNTVTFFDNAIAERSKELALIEERLAKLPAQTPQTPRQVAMKQEIEKIEKLRSALSEKELLESALEEKVKFLTSALAEGEIPQSRQVVDVSATRTERQSDKIRDEILTKQNTMSALRQKYTEQHQLVITLKEEIRQMREQLNTTLEKERNIDAIRGKFSAMKELADTRSQLEQTKKQNSRIREQIAEAEENYKKLVETLQTPEDKMSDQRLAERLSLESQQKFLSTSKQSLEEIKQKLIANQNLIQSPVEEYSLARRANKLPSPGEKSLPLTILTGLIIGIGSAYMLEYMNTSIRTEHDVRRYVNLPMMGMILKIKEPEQRLLMNIAPKSPLSEVFNTIGTLIETHAAEKQGKIFMIASSKAEEGKSTITSNIAVAMARGGAKVLLVDCDLRKAVLHKFFNLDNAVGLSTYLLSRTGSRLEYTETSEKPSGRDTASNAPDGGGTEPTHIALDDVIKPTEIEGLSVLPAGPHPKNPVGILKSDNFKQMITDLRQKADIVLIDVPPVSIAVDTVVLAPLVDGVVLLVSAGETNKDEVTFAKRILESAKGKMIGCILNKVTVESRGYYYYYYYHYYYEPYKYYRES
ncbi:MAG: hypothetical protein A2W23_03500 [Planctomycetes bacterium RBG_16_43_13]|nr:MAG: hypothetical protein A2W23_03500 [Planctomycetes bacterium RBG_16_43_13]